MIQQTLSIIKPDAVSKGVIGPIIAMMEEKKLSVRAVKMLCMSQAQAQGFYAEHKERPFFQSLTSFMTSGPCVVMVLEGENAITRYRELMGDTDSTQAKPGTIRQRFGSDKEKNAVHGSDSPESANREIAFFFAGCELA